METCEVCGTPLKEYELYHVSDKSFAGYEWDCPNAYRHP